MPFITSKLPVILNQGLDKPVWIQLIDWSTGLPITGATIYDVDVAILQNETTSFVEKTLLPLSDDSPNFWEAEDGFYQLVLSGSTDINILGSIVIRIMPKAPNPSSPDPTPEFPDMLEQYLMGDVVPQQLVTVAGPPTCVIFGNVKDLTGVAPEYPYAVKAQLIKFTTLLNDNYISADPIVVYTDINGFFQIRLAQGALIILEIAQAGYRRQFTVPSVSSIDLSAIPNT